MVGTGTAKDNNSQQHKRKKKRGNHCSYITNSYWSDFIQPKRKNEMKKLTQKIEILGYNILIDHKKKEIIFPEDITSEELNSLACYLHDEGFLEAVSK